MSTLSIVATPIGNLEDITLRALRVLREVDLILCEDTRVTKKLLTRYDITTPTMSYHTHSGLTKIEKIFELLADGKNLALVSDAGTPAISDPGSLLVMKVREHFPAFAEASVGKGDLVRIEAIPGPSALTAAVSIAGVPASDFLFLGFLPHKKGRQALFREIAASKRTAIFYESPHRLKKSLEALRDILPQDRRITIARELTKIYEETISGSPQEVLEYFEKNQDKVRGEFVVIVSL